MPSTNYGNARTQPPTPTGGTAQVLRSMIELAKKGKQGYDWYQDRVKQAQGDRQVEPLGIPWYAQPSATANLGGPVKQSASALWTIISMLMREQMKNKAKAKANEPSE